MDTVVNNVLAAINPAVGPIAAEYESLRGLDIAQLKQKLGESLQITAAQVLRMAAIVRLLEERGEDLSDLRFAFLNHLRKIAYGQVIPHLVVQFQGYPMLLDRITALSIADQQKIIEGKAIRIVELTTHGVEHREVEPALMTRDEIFQAFGRGSIRSEAEQVQYLRSKRPADVAAATGKSLSFGAPDETADDPVRAALNEFLTRKGWSAAELARRAQVGYVTVERYLSGKSEIRSGGLAKLLRVAGIRLSLG